MNFTPEKVFSITEIRENGYGSNFNVLNPEDGFRKDNRLWFGKCSVCGQSVTNSFRNGIWEHTVVTERTSNSSVSHNVDYCPKGV